MKTRHFSTNKEEFLFSRFTPKYFQTLKNILEMKNILLICIVLTLGTIQVYGQEISYGTGQWEPQGLSYHRAVIYVSKKAEAVR